MSNCYSGSDEEASNKSFESPDSLTTSRTAIDLNAALMDSYQPRQSSPKPDKHNNGSSINQISFRNDSSQSEKSSKSIVRQTRNSGDTPFSSRQTTLSSKQTIIDSSKTSPQTSTSPLQSG